MGQLELSMVGSAFALGIFASFFLFYRGIFVFEVIRNNL